MNIITYPERNTWADLLKRPTLQTESLRETVLEILNRIKFEGDKAVLEYEEKFDKVQLNSLLVSEEEIAEAEKKVSIELKAAITLAYNNIHTFHAAQVFQGKKITTLPGVTCWQKAVAIEKVGLYIPGGTAPLFSTVLMLATPAQIAGCKEIILCTPPDKEGKIHPAILYAAKLAGISRIFKAGGVQAIGAMAYGTESIPKVYKIFGPGNQYVTAAKQQVSLRDVAIDMPAGPSEVAVLADETANPVFVAADLLSQAEHGTDSQAILITTNETLLKAVTEEVERQLAQLPPEGNCQPFFICQQTDFSEEHGRSRRNDQRICSRAPDYRNQGLHGNQRTHCQCGFRVLRLLFSGKCRRLCFGHQPYSPYQRLCQGLQRSQSGQLHPQDYLPGNYTRRYCHDWSGH